MRAISFQFEYLIELMIIPLAIFLSFKSQTFVIVGCWISIKNVKHKVQVYV